MHKRLEKYDRVYALTPGERTIVSGPKMKRVTADGCGSHEDAVNARSNVGVRLGNKALSSEDNWSSVLTASLRRVEKRAASKEHRIVGQSDKRISDVISKRTRNARQFKPFRGFRKPKEVSIGDTKIYRRGEPLQDGTDENGRSRSRSKFTRRGSPNVPPKRSDGQAPSRSLSRNIPRSLSRDRNLSRHLPMDKGEMSVEDEMIFKPYTLKQEVIDYTYAGGGMLSPSRGAGTRNGLIQKRVTPVLPHQREGYTFSSNLQSNIYQKIHDLYGKSEKLREKSIYDELAKMQSEHYKRRNERLAQKEKKMVDSNLKTLDRLRELNAKYEGATKNRFMPHYVSDDVLERKFGVRLDAALPETVDRSNTFRPKQRLKLRPMNNNANNNSNKREFSNMFDFNLDSKTQSPSTIKLPNMDAIERVYIAIGHGTDPVTTDGTKEPVIRTRFNKTPQQIKQVSPLQQRFPSSKALGPNFLDRPKRSNAPSESPVLTPKRKVQRKPALDSWRTITPRDVEQVAKHHQRETPQRSRIADRNVHVYRDGTLNAARQVRKPFETTTTLVSNISPDKKMMSRWPSDNVSPVKQTSRCSHRDSTSARSGSKISISPLAKVLERQRSNMPPSRVACSPTNISSQGKQPVNGGDVYESTSDEGKTGGDLKRISPNAENGFFNNDGDLGGKNYESNRNPAVEDIVAMKELVVPTKALVTIEIVTVVDKHITSEKPRSSSKLQADIEREREDSTKTATVMKESRETPIEEQRPVEENDQNAMNMEIVKGGNTGSHQLQTVVKETESEEQMGLNKWKQLANKYIHEANIIECKTDDRPFLDDNLNDDGVDNSDIF